MLASFCLAAPNEFLTSYWSYSCFCLKLLSSLFSDISRFLCSSTLLSRSLNCACFSFSASLSSIFYNFSIMIFSSLTSFNNFTCSLSMRPLFINSRSLCCLSSISASFLILRDSSRFFLVIKSSCGFIWTGSENLGIEAALNFLSRSAAVLYF